MKNTKRLLSQRNGTGRRVTVPSPIGGWNTRDSQSSMEATDAVIMENWYPGQGSVNTRNGYIEFVSGLTSYIETLINYSANTTNKLLCANNGEINDITDGSASLLANGFGNNRWQYINFNQYVIMVNGIDTPRTYDGTTLALSTITGVGLTVAELDGINSYKNRIYVWNSNKAEVWYGNTNAIGGTFTKFDLSQLAPNGGNLMTMVTWNLDGSSSVNNYAMFIMSSGDVLLYSGSDPANDFQLVGTYKIGEPLAIRGVLKVAGDVVIMTKRDFVFFSEVYKNDGAVISKSKLSGASIEASRNYASNYGWEAINYAKGGYLLFNIPAVENNTYYQFVINTITGAGCKFTGMNANTWVVFKGDLYFGSNGVVYKADTGSSDNGNEIKCKCQSSFNIFDNNQEKKLNCFRNVLKCDGSLNVEAVVNFDYGNSTSTTSTILENPGTFWDVSFWDVSFWSPEQQLNNKLVIAGGQGTALGMTLNVNIKGQQLFWFRTDYSLSLSTAI